MCLVSAWPYPPCHIRHFAVSDETTEFKRKGAESGNDSQVTAIVPFARHPH
jgi:hypothetical protein